MLQLQSCLFVNKCKMQTASQLKCHWIELWSFKGKCWQTEKHFSFYSLVVNNAIIDRTHWHIIMTIVYSYSVFYKRFWIHVPKQYTKADREHSWGQFSNPEQSSDVKREKSDAVVFTGQQQKASPPKSSSLWYCRFISEKKKPILFHRVFVNNNNFHICKKCSPGINISLTIRMM